MRKRWLKGKRSWDKKEEDLQSSPFPFPPIPSYSLPQLSPCLFFVFSLFKQFNHIIKDYSTGNKFILTSL